MEVPIDTSHAGVAPEWIYNILIYSVLCCLLLVGIGFSNFGISLCRIKVKIF